MGGFFSDFNPLSSAKFGSPFYGLGKKGQTNIFDSSSGQPAASSSTTGSRDLPAELTGLLGQLPAFTASGYNLAAQYNPQYTGLNLANYRSALLGTPTFDTQGYLAAHPDLQSNWNSDPGYAGVYGSLSNYALADYKNNGGGDPRYMPTTGGAADMMRSAYNAANPELTDYTRGLGGVISGMNGQMPTGYSASTMGPISAGPSAMAGFTGAGFTGAGFRGAQGLTANGGPLLGSLNRSAAYNLNRVSPIQSQLQDQAMGMLRTNGGLTAGELANVQDSVRSAYADRGMLRSNSGIGAEIVQTDQARRQRMLENSQYAQGIDASGQQQLMANRNYALGVQGQGQNLSQFNAGLLTNTNTFNAGQANQLGIFNAGQANQIGMYNAGQANQLGMYNAGQANQMGQFNAGLLQQSGLYNAGALNDASRFNSTLQAQNLNDAWGRYMGYGNLQLQQAQNPSGLAMGLMGSTPDYTANLLGYGSDLYNTNFNAAAAANIAAGNNSAANNSALIGGGAAVGGALIIAL